MTVDSELLSQLEALGKLRLDPSQKESFKKDLNEILSYVDTLRAVSAHGEEEFCPKKTDCRLRDDTAGSCENPEKMLKNAESEDGCFTVPKTVE